MRGTQTGGERRDCFLFLQVRFWRGLAKKAQSNSFCNFFSALPLRSLRLRGSVFRKSIDIEQ